jgi:aminopeptidase C
MILFWCLMAKGEKLRLKQMDQLPLENFENSRVRTFVLSKYSKCLFLSKVGLLWGDCLIMGKSGSF